MAERLSNENKMLIQKLVGEGKNSKQIATELDKDEQTVINYVGKVAHELLRLHKNGVNVADGEDATKVEPEKPEHPDPRRRDNSIAPTRIMKNNGFAHKGVATVMTPVAGEISDANRKVTPNRQNRENITVKAKPNGE